MPFFPNHHNVDLFYEVINNEKDLLPVVFVHGFGSSFSMFDSQITLLKKSCKLILFDAEGHGKSQAYRQDIQQNLIENTIEDVNLLLDLLEINNKFGIIGHSLLGSCVALRMALKFPDRVKFLIIMNGGTLELDSTVRNIFWNLLPQFTRMNFHEMINNSVDLLIQKTLPFIRDAIKNSLKDDKLNEKQLDQKIRDDILDMIENELDPSQIQCPTLILGAELDNFAPVYLSKTLRKKISNADLSIVSMAGHFGPSQRSKDYNRFIKLFLTKHKISEVFDDGNTVTK